MRVSRVIDLDSIKTSIARTTYVAICADFVRIAVAENMFIQLTSVVRDEGSNTITMSCNYEKNLGEAPIEQKEALHQLEEALKTLKLVD